MLNSPWDKSPVVSDNPGAKVISLHRGAVAHISAARVARAKRDPGMLAALAERAEEIAYDDFYVRGGMTRLGTPARHVIVRAPSRLERITWWLGDTYGSGPRGLLCSLFVGAIWLVCILYCIAIWTGVAAEFGL